MTSSFTSKQNMIALQLRSSLARRLAAGAAAASLVMLGGCKSDEILKARTPDVLTPGSLSTSAGANTLRLGAIQNLYNAFAGSVDSYAVVTGNLGDEIRSTDTFDDRILPDRRQMNDNLPSMTTPYLNLHKARTAATRAIVALTATLPLPKFNNGEQYVDRGFAEDFLGEMYCSGVPFSGDDGNTPGTPLTTAQIFTISAASFDSALALADTSTRVKYAAQIGKARALLNNGQYAAAAAAVSGVPTTFKFLAYYSLTTSENGIYNATAAAGSRYGVSDKEGGNGLAYLSQTGDARLPWAASARSGFNTLFSNQPTQLKQIRAGNVVMADGIEARLIEAEARLQSDTQADRDAVFATLNSLRQTGITPAVPVIAGTAPTTKDAAITQLFAERGYWFWLTGHRLGDLRRLVRQYNRGAETVFPTGTQAAPLSSQYGTDVNFIIPSQEKNNLNFTGCIDRKA